MKLQRYVRAFATAVVIPGGVLAESCMPVMLGQISHVRLMKRLEGFVKNVSGQLPVCVPAWLWGGSAVWVGLVTKAPKLRVIRACTQDQLKNVFAFSFGSHSSSGESLVRGLLQFYSSAFSFLNCLAARWRHRGQPMVQQVWLTAPAAEGIFCFLFPCVHAGSLAE